MTTKPARRPVSKKTVSKKSPKKSGTKTPATKTKVPKVKVPKKQEKRSVTTENTPPINVAIPATLAPAGSVEYAPPRRKVSAYAGVFEKLRILTKGQEMTIPVPSGRNPRDFITQLTSAIRNSGVKAPDNHVFLKRPSKDGKLISIVIHPATGKFHRGMKRHKKGDK